VKFIGLSNNSVRNRKFPSGWEYVKLGALSELTGGDGAPQDPDAFKDGTIPFVRMKDVGRYRFTLNLIETEDRLNKAAVEKYRMRIFPKGTILMPRSGSVYTNHRARLAVPAAVVGHLAAILPRDDVFDSQFVTFALKLIDMRQWMTKTTGLDSISLKDLSAVIIPLPPLPEQKRIAAILNEQMAAVERARVASEVQLGSAKALPAAYFRAVFNSPEAKKWPSKFLGDICTRISNGTTKTQNNNKFGLPVTRIETISNGHIDMNRVGWVELIPDEIEKYKLEDGDILFSHINSVERLGNCSIYNQQEIPALIHGMNLLRIQVSRLLVDPFYLLHFLRTENAKNFYTEQARRAIGQASLNTKDLGKLQVPLPSLSEQGKMERNLNGQILRVTTTIKIVSDQLDAINQLPAKILQQAFNGEM